MNRIKALKLVSNILFWSGIALAVAAFVKTYIDSAGLPPGVCPFDRNRWLTYSAFGVLLASLAFSFLTDFLKRKQRGIEKR